MYPAMGVCMGEYGSVRLEVNCRWEVCDQCVGVRNEGRGPVGRMAKNQA